MTEIEPIDLEDLRASGAALILLDVREADEIARASLSESLQIPMAQVPEKLNQLRRDIPIVVMCHHGARSERICRYLESQGYPDVANLKGGIDAWSTAIDSTIPRY